MDRIKSIQSVAGVQQRLLRLLILILEYQVAHAAQSRYLVLGTISYRSRDTDTAVLSSICGVHVLCCGLQHQRLLYSAMYCYCIALCVLFVNARTATYHVIRVQYRLASEHLAWWVLQSSPLMLGNHTQQERV